MPDRTTLFTSLPPLVTRQIADAEVGFSYLAECVNSWKRAGFELISLNSAAEIQHLEHLGYDVEYRPVSGSRPKINDFLDAILASRARVAGIVNADILLANDPALLGALAHHATSAMVVVERVNIDPRGLRPTGRSCYGFDAMIFGTEPLSQIDGECELLFGEPWWDYWLPLAYAAAGGRLMIVGAPLIFHLDHAQNWNLAQWIGDGERIFGLLQNLCPRLPQDFADGMQRFRRPAGLTENDLRAFADWCFAWLRSAAEPIAPPRQANGGNSLAALIAALDDAKMRGLFGELNEAEARMIALQRAEKTRAGLQDEIQRISSILNGRQIVSDDEALRAVSEAARILASRGPSLAHFATLNSAWLKRAGAAALRRAGLSRPR